MLIHRRTLTTRVLEAIHFAVPNHAALLHSLIVAAPNYFPIVHEHGANGNAAGGQAFLRFIYRCLQKWIHRIRLLSVIESSRTHRREIRFVRFVASRRTRLAHLRSASDARDKASRTRSPAPSRLDHPTIRRRAAHYPATTPAFASDRDFGAL